MSMTQHKNEMKRDSYSAGYQIILQRTEKFKS